jgi:hypothetical protein
MGQTSRPKAISPADQDLSAGLDLKLGEMQNVDTLTVSEAALVVNSILAKRAMDNNEPPQLNQCVLVQPCSTDSNILKEVVFRSQGPAASFELF